MVRASKRELVGWGLAVAFGSALGAFVLVRDDSDEESDNPEGDEPDQGNEGDSSDGAVELPDPPTPNAEFEYEIIKDGEWIRITYVNGDPLLAGDIYLEAGVVERWSELGDVPEDYELQPGDSAENYVQEPREIVIEWRPGDGIARTLDRWQP